MTRNIGSEKYRYLTSTALFVFKKVGFTFIVVRKVKKKATQLSHSIV